MARDQEEELIIVTKEKRIQRLLNIANEGEGKRDDQKRLNFTERRFLLKHPDWVREVFSGERSHVRANRIVMKMLMLDLNSDDFDEVYEVLKRRKM